MAADLVNSRRCRWVCRRMRCRGSGRACWRGRVGCSGCTRPTPPGSRPLLAPPCPHSPATLGWWTYPCRSGWVCEASQTASPADLKAGNEVKMIYLYTYILVEKQNCIVDIKQCIDNSSIASHTVVAFSERTMKLNVSVCKMSQSWGKWYLHG